MGIFKAMVEALAEVGNPPSFVVDNGLPQSERDFLKAVAAEITIQIPALKAHGISGENANTISLNGSTVEIFLGPLCSSGTCGGQTNTLELIVSALQTNEPMRQHQMGYAVYNGVEELAWG